MCLLPSCSLSAELIGRVLCRVAQLSFSISVSGVCQSRQGFYFGTFRSSRIVTRVIFQEMKSDHGSAADEVDDDDGEDCDDVDGGNA